MKYRRQVTPRADADVRLACQWYASQAPEQVPRFLSEYQTTAHAIQRHRTSSGRASQT